MRVQRVSYTQRWARKERKVRLHPKEITPEKCFDSGIPPWYWAFVKGIGIWHSQVGRRIPAR